MKKVSGYGTAFRTRGFGGDLPPLTQAQRERRRMYGKIQPLESPRAGLIGRLLGRA